MSQRWSSIFFLCVILLLVPSISARSQAQDNPFPRLIRYSGWLPTRGPTAAAYVTNLTFSLFGDQQGGTALWTERQNVQIGENGRYEVLLGSASSDGIPPELFGDNRARWLAIRTEDGTELPRVLLTSVPFAAKAFDAETLGGHPLSSFMLQESAPVQFSTSLTGTTRPKANVVIDPGTPNYLAKFVDTSTISASSVSENTTGLGLDVPSPTQRLDVYGRIKLRARGSATSGLWLTDVNGGEQLFLGQIGLDSSSPLGFWHGGAWRFAMTNAGDVGIGVGITPGARLDLGGRAMIRASSQGSSGVWFTGATGNRVLFVGQKGITSNDAFGIWHNNAWRFTIDLNGNVGIGVDPQFRLDLSGRMRLRAAGTQPSGSWYSGESDSPQLFVGQTDTVAAAPFGIMHGGSWRFLLQSDGKVGIGTTSPTALLEVAGNLKLSNGGKLVFADGTSLASATAAQQTITSSDPAIVVTTSGSNTQIAIANSGIGTSKLADASVTASKLAPNLPATTIAGIAATLGPNSFLGSQVVDGTFIVSINDGINYAITARNTASTDAGVALRAETNSIMGSAISAMALSSTGNAVGINTKTNAPTGKGIYSEASASSGVSFGVHGVSRSSQGVGVQGEIASTQGTNYGVVGITSAGNYSAGVYAQSNATSTSSTNYALLARNQGNNGVGVFAHAASMTGATYGVYGRVDSASGIAGMFMTSAASGNVIAANNASRRIFRVDTTGTVYALGAFTPGGADYAESVSVRGGRDQYHPGDVMVIDPDSDRQFTLSSEPYSTRVAGVYSTKPGVLGSTHPLESAEDELPLAMVGIVPCRVSDENGPIHRGDLLVTSSMPGYAMRGTDRDRMQSAVIGKALQNFDSGTGVIEIIVTLQ